MNSNRNCSVQIIKNKMNILSCFLSRYTYSLRTQLRDKKSLFEELSSKEKATIADAVEEKIKWLDANPAAKIDEFRKHKKQLEAIVMRIMSRFDGQNSNETRSQSSAYYGEL